MDVSRNSSSAASTTANCDALMRKKSTDVAWDYAVIVDASNKERLRCTLCGNVYNGGINRMKKHIAQIKGEVASCTKASKEDQLKCKKALDDIAAKKLEKKKEVMNLREEVNVIHESDGFEDNEVGNVGSKKRPYDLGPMDSYTKINPDGSDTSGFKTTRQQNLNDAIWKERSHQVNQYLARWVYEAGIPFHAVDNDSFKRFVEAVGQFGPGYRPPGQYQLREPLLKEEVERTKTLLKKQEAEWASTGCSIMTDAWTDRKRRSIMNLCVNCKQGTCFLSSKEDSEASHTGVYIFDYIDKFIEDIGVQNVVQVVTDNASNNVAAADLLKIKRPNIFWTSCAAHTINLMLEGIGGIRPPEGACLLHKISPRRGMPPPRRFHSGGACLLPQDFPQEEHSPGGACLLHKNSPRRSMRSPTRFPPGGAFHKISPRRSMPPPTRFHPGGAFPRRGMPPPQYFTQEEHASSHNVSPRRSMPPPTRFHPGGACLLPQDFTSGRSMPLHNMDLQEEQASSTTLTSGRNEASSVLLASGGARLPPCYSPPVEQGFPHEPRLRRRKLPPQTPPPEEQGLL
ncbi:hypothetical protein RHMOL_Rhmol10G0150200 [Rhododendron molle]|uniref:Uncharacterized protein n=1 Tax=Rhododendron molle TaxID=49168 RepID=A0ACC0M2L7_RHOML|nr:hypothetical protein RHMOL_Rhmol10G0150200 [Rhododendron molle]